MRNRGQGHEPGKPCQIFCLVNLQGGHCALTMCHVHAAHLLVGMPHNSGRHGACQGLELFQADVESDLRDCPLRQAASSHNAVTCCRHRRHCRPARHTSPSGVAHLTTDSCAHKRQPALQRWKCC